jgi:hypothetical protein
MLEQEWKMEVEKAMAGKEGRENTDTEELEEKDTGDYDDV